jgi:hypothetical protein
MKSTQVIDQKSRPLPNHEDPKSRFQMLGLREEQLFTPRYDAPVSCTGNLPLPGDNSPEVKIPDARAEGGAVVHT